MTSTIDTIRMIFTYAIASAVVVGGGAMLLITYADPNAADVRVIIAGFMGAAITFVFQQETQTRTARQTNTAQMAGGTMHANGIAGGPIPPA